jgi:hypothetical protein
MRQAIAAAVASDVAVERAPVAVEDPDSIRERPRQQEAEPHLRYHR